MSKICGVCGYEMEETRGDYHFTECGVPGVILEDTELLKCPKCGNVEPVLWAIKSLGLAIAKGILSKRGRPGEGSQILLSGEEFRYLRKFLGMNVSELARWMDEKPETLTAWENNDKPIDPANDAMLRFYVKARLESFPLYGDDETDECPFRKNCPFGKKHK